MLGNLTETKRFIRKQLQFTISTIEARTGLVNAGTEASARLDVFVDRKLNKYPITITIDDVDLVRPNLIINQDVLGADDSVTTIELGAIDPLVVNGDHRFIITGTDSKGRTFDRTVAFTTNLQPN